MSDTLTLRSLSPREDDAVDKTPAVYSNSVMIERTPQLFLFAMLDQRAAHKEAKCRGVFAVPHIAARRLHEALGELLAKMDKGD